MIFLLIASYVSKIADKIHISEKKSNLDIEKQKQCAIINIKKEVGCKYAYTI